VNVNVAITVIATAASVITARWSGAPRLKIASGRDIVFANAVRDASKTAVEHAAAVNDAIADTGIVRTVSRITYTGAYALSFGIVYTAVFATQWIPQDNPVMVGLSACLTS
jgi:hypothetical protein